MARMGDERKRRDWESRLQRYRASELTVAAFCSREGVSIATFQYWSRRLAGAVRGPRVPGSPSPVAERFSISELGVVRFRFESGAEVVVPADRLDAIRCVAECLGSARRGGAAFQEVVVASG
jgi:hypothetical protein